MRTRAKSITPNSAAAGTAPARTHEPAFTLPPGADWGDAYEGHYRAMAQKMRVRRQKAAARRQAGKEGPKTLARKAEVAAAWGRFRDRHPGLEPNTVPYFAALQADPDGPLLMQDRHEAMSRIEWAERAREKATQAERILAGGLASDQHPMLKKFVASVPAAARLFTGRDKAMIYAPGSKLIGLDEPYVVANTEMRGALRVDVDRVFPGGIGELSALLAAQRIPAPNIVVGHDGEGGLRHPHLIWLLSDAVWFGEGGGLRHQGLWRRVLDGLTAACLILGADPGGTFNPMRMKCPLSPAWSWSVLADEPYSLAGLRPSLDLAGARDRLRGQPARQGFPEDHPDPAVASQSNAHFRRVAAYARGIAPTPDADEAAWGAFGDRVAMEAIRVAPEGELAHRAAGRMAEAVAAWTRKNYRRRVEPARCASMEERKARLAAGARAAAAVKRGGTLAAIIDAAQRVQAVGAKPTQAAVAAATGKSERTVRTHWPEVIASLDQGTQEPATSLPIVKKNACSPAPAGGAVPAASFHSPNTAQDGPPEPRQPQLKTKRVGGGWRRADAEDRESALAALPDLTTNPACGDPVTAGGAWDRWRQRALRDNGRPPSPDEVRFVIGLGEPWLSHMLTVWRQPRRPRRGWQQRLEAEWWDYLRGARR